MTRTYQTEARDWHADRYQAVYVSRNRWLVTALAGFDPGLSSGGGPRLYGAA